MLKFLYCIGNRKEENRGYWRTEVVSYFPFAVPLLDSGLSGGVGGEPGAARGARALIGSI